VAGDRSRRLGRTDMKARAWFRGLGIGAALLLLALVAARTTSSWIAAAFPGRPFASDLLFETLPHLPQLGYVVDAAVTLALALLLVYALRASRREIPMMMALFAVMQFLRALMTILTPLASPLHGSAYYGISSHVDHALAPVAAHLHDGAYYTLFHATTNLAQNGEFPSGHMATVFLCMLLVQKSKAPQLKTVMVLLVVLECVALLMTHQHYSIDVIGGLLLSYWVYHAYVEGTGLGWLKRLIGN
jgi:membrane-associated phospholipid phosphatase